MTADDFLADLEARADAAAREQQRYEVADTVRTENSRVTLSDRTRAALGRTSVAYVRGAPIRGTVIDVAPGWLALDTERSLCAQTTSDLLRRGVCVIEWSALEALSLENPRFVTSEESGIGRTWNALFRACAGARTAVVWHTKSGQTFNGIIGAVGKDHVVLSSRGVHTALTTQNLALLEPFAARPERADFQKSSRIRPA